MLLSRALPLALALACGPALAQTAQKPIQIIVPFAPGASADGAARIVANALVDALSVLGVKNVAMPATPEVLWRAIHGARGK